MMNRSRNLFTALGLLAFVPLAHAGYVVEGQVSGWSSAGYNHNAHTGGYINYAAFGSPTAYAPSDLTGTLTAASFGVAGNGPGFPHDPNTYDQIAASVDLSTVAETMTEYDTGTNGGDGTDGGTSATEMDDVLTFLHPGVGSSDVTTISYTRTLQGSLAQSGSAFDAHGELSATFNLVGAGIGGNVDIQLGLVNGQYVSFVNGAGGSGTYTTLTPTLIVQTGTFSFQGSSFSASFSMNQSSWAYSGMDENFTQSFQFGLADGVSLTSDSGVFGSQPVPEPSALVSLFGCAAVFTVRRRRHR